MICRHADITLQKRNKELMHKTIWDKHSYKFLKTNQARTTQKHILITKPVKNTPLVLEFDLACIIAHLSFAD